MRPPTQRELKKRAYERQRDEWKRCPDCGLHYAGAEHPEAKCWGRLHRLLATCRVELLSHNRSASHVTPQSIFEHIDSVVGSP